MASIGIIFTSTYHTKQLNQWTNSSHIHKSPYIMRTWSSLNQLCGESQPAVCLLRGDGATWTPELSWIPDKPQKQATPKAAWKTSAFNTLPKCWLMHTAIVWCWKVCLAVVCVEAFLRFGYICSWWLDASPVFALD